MNSNMFYRGVLDELSKSASQVITPNKPKPKPSILRNPMLWGGLGLAGLGLAGLGGYGLAKAFGNKDATPAAPPTTTRLGDINISKATKNFLEDQGPSTLGFVALQRASKPVGGMVNAGVLASAAENIHSGITNDDGYGTAGRLGQIYGSGALPAAMAAAHVAKVTPAASSSPWFNSGWDAIRRGSRFVRGVPTPPTLAPQSISLARAAGAPLLAGHAAKTVLEQSGNAAEEHTGKIDALTENLLTYHKLMRSPDKATSDWAKEQVREAFSDPETMKEIDGITNPGWWAGMGYDPVPRPLDAVRDTASLVSGGAVQSSPANKLTPSFASLTKLLSRLSRDANR